ncbi:MAG: histone deacetylase [Sulfurovaceae bacterium]|nr:histone deacetylase [Sulfurovaceae bacterium]
MKKVAWITDDIYLQHDTGTGHPESVERLISINLKITSLEDKLIAIAPRLATKSEINLVHTMEHIDDIQERGRVGLPVDADTILSKQSYSAARKAVGAGLVAIDGIKSDTFQRAFCAVRPPGHHATPTQSMGFCLFNNIAVTARYAQEQGYKKVMIIDFDVHHGNGTQDAFYDDNSVFYFSTHEAYAYPGTGNWVHKGRDAGEGFTGNYPLMPESGDKDILEFYHEDLPKHYSEFQPDIILVSAGYDLHESDPLANLSVTTEGIRDIVRSILDLGDKPVVFMLEGGYSVTDLGWNVVATVEEMLV